ncbi:MAG: PilW family protein [Gammaproteobacteria bacterium]|nr:PilW family protein [Gammaproteobacteria bacterium]
MNHTTFKIMHLDKQRGLTLMEVMVAITISLILLAGVMQIFLGSRQTYRMQDGLARLQENGRFAMDFLSRDIRMAGYQGCRRAAMTVNNTLAGAIPASFNPGMGLQGWEATSTGPGQTYSISSTNVATVSTAGGGWTTAGGATLEDFQAVPGSDIVRIWTMGENPADIDNITPGANTIVDTPQNSVFANDEILMLSDCMNADVVQVCNIQTIGSGQIRLNLNAGCAPGNIAAMTLSTSKDGQVSRLVSNIYYVGKRNNDPNNPPALFRRPLGGATLLAGNPEELLEGVESMQVLYGEDTDGDRTANRYVTANNVANWANVVSARLALLMRSVEEANSTTDGNIYQTAETTIDPADDRRLRRVFTTTLQIRNRGQ